jgi:soluble lytic murein transglycosylase-like protein
MRFRTLLIVSALLGFAAPLSSSQAASFIGYHNNPTYNSSGIFGFPPPADGSFAPAAVGKSNIRNGVAGRSQYASIVERHARAAGVPVALALAVVNVESRYNPRTTGRAGEIGLMQIKLQTARAMGYRGSRQGLYDPETNIKFGMLYLAGAHKLGGGTTCGTILKYNGGHYAKRMQASTRQYCARVQKLMASN